MDNETRPMEMNRNEFTEPTIYGRIVTAYPSKGGDGVRGRGARSLTLRSVTPSDPWNKEGTAARHGARSLTLESTTGRHRHMINRHRPHL